MSALQLPVDVQKVANFVNHIMVEGETYNMNSVEMLLAIKTINEACKQALDYLRKQQINTTPRSG